MGCGYTSLGAMSRGWFLPVIPPLTRALIFEITKKKKIAA